jgi:hypothetical protein
LLFSPHGNFWKFVKTHTRTQTSQAIHKLSRWVGTNGSLSKKCTQDNCTVVIIWGISHRLSCRPHCTTRRFFCFISTWNKVSWGQGGCV